MNLFNTLYQMFMPDYEWIAAYVDSTICYQCRHFKYYFKVLYTIGCDGCKCNCFTHKNYIKAEGKG